MTKMAAMLKSAQNFKKKKKIFSRTTVRIALKLGMYHQGLYYCKV